MTTQLEEFRQQLYKSMSSRADALMDLLDALSSNTMAHSVVELSLNPPFRYRYSSLYDAIDNFFEGTSAEAAPEERRMHEQGVMRLITPYLPVPKQRRFWLFGLDVTPAPRPFSETLEDRTYVYQPNTIRTNKPIAIGHQYSTLVAFPEKESDTAPCWVVPLSIRRVGSQERGTVVGAQQVETLLTDEKLPFGNELCVEVVDSAYSALSFLGRVTDHDNLVTIARMRGNRTLYRIPPKDQTDHCGKGHPTWYGKCFNLSDSTTWGPPDEVAQTTYTNRKGSTYTVHLEAWHNLLMRGTHQFTMHQYPFTLIRCQVLDTNGHLVFHRPLWLLIMGKRRHELSIVEAWQAYGQRYDVEHFFRFGKQRLLMTAYQTPQLEHEENWWQIVQLAYVQLWLARSLAQTMPRPWERYLARPLTGIASPTTVQRDFGRIIRQFGTIANTPKPRGKSPGRTKGHRPEPRKRLPVLKKGSQIPQRAHPKA